MPNKNARHDDDWVMTLFRWFILTIVFVAGSYVIAAYLPYYLRGFVSGLWPLGKLLLGEHPSPVSIAAGMIGVAFVAELRALITNWTGLRIVDGSRRDASGAGSCDLIRGHAVMMLANCLVTGVLAVAVNWFVTKLIPAAFGFGFSNVFGASFTDVASRFPFVAPLLLILALMLLLIPVYIVMRRRRRGRPSAMDVSARKHAFKLVLAFGQWAVVTFALILLTTIGDGGLTGVGAVIAMTVIIVVAAIAHQTLAAISNQTR